MSLLNICLLLSFIFSNIANYYSSFISPLKGGEIDAEKFLTGALEWSQHGEFQAALNTEFFTQYLGFFVKYFGFDRFLLSSLGIFAFYVVLFLLLRALRRLLFACSITPTYSISSDHYIRIKPLLLSFLRLSLLYVSLLTPSVILRIGNLAREPYIAIGLAVASFCLILQVFSSIFKKNSLAIAIILVCSTIAFISFHKGSIFFFVFAWVLFTYLLIFTDNSLLTVFRRLIFTLRVNQSVVLKSAVASVLSLIIILSGLAFFNSLSQSKATLLISSAFSADTDQLNKIGISKSSKEADAQYNIGFDLSNPLAASLTTVRANIYYYAYPFIPKTPPELFIFFDNFLRLFVLSALFYTSFYNTKSSSARRAVHVVLIFYFLCNTVFALGTANYGTGSRHHATLTPILLLTYPFLRTKTIKNI